jgi:hypothetical protein
MSFMFEVYYNAPIDETREIRITEQVKKLGGRLDYREGPNTHGPNWIVLTFDFDDFDTALAAADLLRTQGERVDGPYNYGP